MILLQSAKRRLRACAFICSFSSLFSLSPLFAQDVQSEPLPLPLEEVRMFTEALDRIRMAYVEEVDDKTLLENAIRHTDPEDRKISITLIPEGSGARILVQDNGGGIPDSERNSIFEPFYRRPSSSRGFGLGLSLVHRIIESHEGTIELDSSGSAGTTFIIWLPGTDSRGQKPGTES